MKNLSTAFTCFCLFLTFNAFGQSNEIGRLATARPLKPLNTAAFSSKLSQNLLRQSFTHLVSSSQVAALSPAEQTLFLTHKFVEENHRLPRTLIFGKIPAEYTRAQQLETTLGNQFRLLRESPKTPTAIRRESIQLQRDFSPNFAAMRVLENLNDWLVHKQIWPRASITHEGPLTETEIYEMDLALATEKMVFNSKTLPQALIDQIIQVREYYDPSYMSATQQAEEQKNRQLAAEERQRSREIHQYYYRDTEKPETTRMPWFYNNDNLPIDPATGRQQVLPTPDYYNILHMEEKAFFEFAVTVDDQLPATIDNWREAIKVLINLERWLNKFHTWPQVLSMSQFARSNLQEIQGHYLALQMASICKLNSSFQARVENLYEKWISQKDTYNP